MELQQIRWLLERGAVVICAGGGGIPTAYDAEGRLTGVEAVIDKDHASELLATSVDADVFVMATDTDAVYLDWGTPDARPVVRAHPDALMDRSSDFGEGSMRPKVEAACNFARETGRRAVIGAPSDLIHLVEATAGTSVTVEQTGIELGPTREVRRAATG